eukprot:26338_1
MDIEQIDVPEHEKSVPLWLDDLSDDPTSDNLLTVNRQQFMRTAPSLVQLLTTGSSPKSTASGNHVDAEQLTIKAAQEFETLTAQNDNLFRAKERYKQKNHDLQQDIQDLQQQINESEMFRDQNQLLLSQQGTYETQIKIFEQEKLILQDTIHDLKQQLPVHVQDSTDHAPDVIPQNVENEAIVELETDIFMSQISKLTQEKNAADVELETFKLEIENKNKNITTLTKQIVDLEKDVERLTANLEKQQDHYVQLSQSTEHKKRGYVRRMTLQTDQIQDEAHAKENKLLKTIEEQKKRIQALEEENREMVKEKYDATKKRSSSGGHIGGHLRLRTKQNVFGDQPFDLDPFGGDADEYLNESRSSGDDALGDGVPAFHEAESAGSHSPEKYLMTRQSTSDQMETTQKACCCFKIPFKKYTKYKTSSRGSSDAPLAELVQEHDAYQRMSD